VVVEMDDAKLYVPDDVLEGIKKYCLQNQNYNTRNNWKNLQNGRPRNGSKE
jgi:hypothetical protein